MYIQNDTVIDGVDLSFCKATYFEQVEASSSVAYRSSDYFFINAIKFFLKSSLFDGAKRYYDDLESRMEHWLNEMVALRCHKKDLRAEGRFFDNLNNCTDDMLNFSYFTRSR